MPLQVPCGQCKTQCTVPDSFAGRVIQCPYCQAPLRIPGPPQETAAPSVSPLLDMLNEELAGASAAPGAGTGDLWAVHGHRSRSKFRLPGPVALAVAGGGAFAFFVLMVALFPKVGLPLGWLVVAGGAIGLFAAVCWLIYDVSCVPPHRRRTGTAMLGVLGALGCAGIGALGVLYASWELDRREHPEKYAAKAPPPVAAPTDGRGRSDEKGSAAGAAKPGEAAPGQPGVPPGGPPAATKPKAEDIPPADDLVSFDPSRFGKAAPGAKPVQGLPPPDPDANPIETAYEEASRAYAAEAAADLLASDDASFRERMLWFPLANRPVMGLRWAFGLQSSDPAGGPQVAPSEDVEKQIKAVSLALVGGLDQRMAARSFGQWPETGDARFRQVAVLRNGRRHELVAAAKRRAVDVLVTVEPVAVPAPGGKPPGTLKIDLVDLTEDRSLATFPRASGVAAGAASTSSAQTPAAGLAEEFLKFVDDNCALKPVPWSVVEQAKPRVARLAARPPPLHAAAALLLEVRYYQVRQLIPAGEAIQLYDAVLGAGNGEKLATGDAARRREALQAWVKGTY